MLGLVVRILSFTQENAVDLLSMGSGLLVTNKGGWLSPAQTTAKVKYKVHSQWLY
jgi:hypothetical protein